VALERFRVMKCRPGAPAASKSVQSRLASSIPISRTASGSSANGSIASRTRFGIGAPEKDAIRLIWETFVIGMMPGMIGMSRPVAASRSTSRR